MALFLANKPVIKIMIFDCWSSAALMGYICAQVLEWTANLSQSMLKCLDFRHALLSDNTDHSELNPAIQLNVDVAIDSPEETTFNGFVATANFDQQMNLEH